MKIIRNITLMLCAVLFCACSQQPAKTNSYGPHRLIHNNDGTDLLGNWEFGRRPLTLADLDSAVRALAYNKVTTFSICTGSDMVYYRTQYANIIGDDLNGTVEIGPDTATYNDMHSYYLNHLILEKEGTDLIDYTLRQARKYKMETFITYRMNDLHFTDTTTHCPITYSKFWYQHPEYWTHENLGWHADCALDFAHQEVRDLKLAMISEQLDRYGDLLDGYEMDFMRFIVYFKRAEARANAPLITQLVRDVRTKVDALSKEKGHKILLSVRVPPTEEQCLSKGLDIRQWLREGLVDFVITGIHWSGDPAMPVAKFKEELGSDLNVPLYSTVDDGGYSRREEWSHGMFRGMCSHIMAQGADGVNLFNFYSGKLGSYEERLRLKEGGQVCRTIMHELLQELGSLETLKGRNKIYGLDEQWQEYDIYTNSPLPFTLSKSEAQEMEIYVGDDPADGYPQEVILFFRTDRPTEKMQIAINGQPVTIAQPTYPALYDRENTLRDTEKVYAFTLPDKVLKQGYNTIRFLSDETKPVIIRRVELALKYGDVETCGYF